MTSQYFDLSFVHLAPKVFDAAVIETFPGFCFCSSGQDETFSWRESRSPIAVIHSTGLLARVQIWLSVLHDDNKPLVSVLHDLADRDQGGQAGTAAVKWPAATNRSVIGPFGRRYWPPTRLTLIRCTCRDWTTASTPLYALSLILSLKKKRQRDFRFFLWLLTACGVVLLYLLTCVPSLAKQWRI